MRISKSSLNLACTGNDPMIRKQLNWLNHAVLFAMAVFAAAVPALSLNVREVTVKTPPTSTSRRQWIQQKLIQQPAACAFGAALGFNSLSQPLPANAAPPIAVIAEELGYFPVTDRQGNTMYIPKRVKRSSTPQAIELAKALKEKNIVMYGAYWCPHCSRQKELFGKEAWDIMVYVECSPKGYGFNSKVIPNDIDGYPTFRDGLPGANSIKRGGGKVIDRSGEISLDLLAEQIGFVGFDPTLEDPVPLVGTACKIR